MAKFFAPQPGLQPLIFVLSVAVVGASGWIPGQPSLWALAWGIEFLIVAFGVGFGFHRAYAHGAVDSYVWPLRWAAALGSLSLIGSPQSWKSIHDRHHEFADADQDPHSPSKLGLKVLWSAVGLEPEKSLSNSSADPVLEILHRYHYLWWLGVGSLTWIFLGPQILYFGFLLPSALAYLSLQSLNFFAHGRGGYRNFPVKDRSKNIFWLWPLLFGENWHNNHHHNPHCRSTKSRLWESDPVWIFCFLFDRGTWMKARFQIRKLKLRFFAKPKDYIYYEPQS